MSDKKVKKGRILFTDKFLLNSPLTVDIMIKDAYKQMGFSEKATHELAKISYYTYTDDNGVDHYHDDFLQQTTTCVITEHIE